MKKLISMVVLTIMLFSLAHAESLDFSSMTDDELITAYEAAKAEMSARGIVPGAERTLREGKYIIGRDISAGNYTITCLDTAGSSFGDAYGSLGNMMDALDDSNSDWGSLYGSLGGIMSDLIDLRVEIIGDYGDVLRSYEMKAGDSFSIKLEEGTALQISDGSCTIIPE